MFRILLMIAPCLPLLAQAQKKQETIARFVITESTRNGIDNTAFDVQRSGYFAFYTDDDGTLLFANVSDATGEQSWGQVFELKSKTNKETSSTYESTTFAFRWKYQNSYNEKKGYATCRLDKIYKPQGVVFTLRMVLTNLDVLNYSGYMEGSLDLDEFTP